MLHITIDLCFFFGFIHFITQNVIVKSVKSNLVHKTKVNKYLLFVFSNASSLHSSLGTQKNIILNSVMKFISFS